MFSFFAMPDCSQRAKENVSFMAPKYKKYFVKDKVRVCLLPE
jgi:hypothetical protein